jgi:hypothetical protein
MTALILALLVCACACRAQSVPLFVIERSLNANVVHYDARLAPDGKLDPKQPIVAYWIMAAEDGRRQELNLIERLKAYGFTAQPEKDWYRLVLAAEKRREIHVYLDHGSVKAEMLIGGHKAFLHRVYVGTHKSFGLPMPSYVELFGSDVATGDDCYEKVLP